MTAKIVPKQMPSLKKQGEVYVFKRYEFDFLKEYSACLDEKQALAQAGIDSRRCAEILNNTYVKVEMSRIQRAWQYRARLTQEHAGGEHMRLMEKFEGQYDKGKEGDRSKMAGVLAKMSETSMKATGLIGSERDQAMPTVIVNMNMGDVENVSVAIEKTGE